MSAGMTTPTEREISRAKTLRPSRGTRDSRRTSQSMSDGSRSLSANEREGGRKASGRERRVAISGSEPLGRVPELRHEFRVELVQISAHVPACGMKTRGRRFLRLPRLTVGILLQDRFRTERRNSGLLAVSSRLDLDVRHHRSESSQPDKAEEQATRVSDEPFASPLRSTALIPHPASCP